MLLLTVFKPEFCAFQQSHTMLLIVFLVGWVGGYVVLVYGQVARKYPHSLVLTCIYTVSQAYCVSYICGGYLVPAHNSTILVAAIMTLCTSMFMQVWLPAVQFTLIRLRPTSPPTRVPR